MTQHEGLHQSDLTEVPGTRTWRTAVPMSIHVADPTPSGMGEREFKRNFLHSNDKFYCVAPADALEAHDALQIAARQQGVCPQNHQVVILLEPEWPIVFENPLLSARAANTHKVLRVHIETLFALIRDYYAGKGTAFCMGHGRPNVDLVRNLNGLVPLTVVHHPVSVGSPFLPHHTLRLAVGQAC